MQKKIIEDKGKAVIYARYSSDRQREESIEASCVYAKTTPKETV